MKKYATRRTTKRRSKTMRKQKGGRPPCELWSKCPRRERKFNPFNNKSPEHVPKSCYESDSGTAPTCCSECNCQWGTLPKRKNVSNNII